MMETRERCGPRARLASEHVQIPRENFLVEQALSKDGDAWCGLDERLGFSPPCGSE